MMFGLSIGRAQAVGHLECLWHWTAKYARRGDIGKWNDGAIAAAAEFTGNPARFVEVLTDCGWLDPSEECRLFVHDWHSHADEAVHRELARARERFANGHAPRLGGLDKEEKPEAKTFYAKKVRCAKNRATSGPRLAPPLPPAVAVALPSPAIALPRLAVAEPENGAPPPTFGPQIQDRDERVREGYALLAEIASLDGRDPQEILRDASEIKASGYYLLALDAAKPEHLLRTLNRLRDAAKALRPKAVTVSADPDVSRAPELAAEFLSWHEGQPAGETQGQAIVRWWKSKGIEFGKPLAVAISQHVRSLLAQPKEASA